jgi:hypothetical protein
MGAGGLAYAWLVIGTVFAEIYNKIDSVQRSEELVRMLPRHGYDRMGSATIIVIFSRTAKRPDNNLL